MEEISVVSLREYLSLTLIGLPYNLANFLN